MSHGADTSDFEAMLGPMPLASGQCLVTEPVMFVLEAPGGNPDEKNCVEDKGIKKYPPLRNYYWMPDPGDWRQDTESAWPDRMPQFSRFYGSSITTKTCAKIQKATGAVRC